MIGLPRSGRPPAAGVRSVLVGLLLLASLGQATSTAAAQDADAPKLAIGPSRFEVDAEDGRLVHSVVVQNEGPVPLQVEVETTALGHDLEGRLLFPELADPSAVSGPSESFSLEPGGAREYEIDARVPDGDFGLYAAVVATGRLPDAGQRVVEQIRVASVVLLRRPGAWDRSVEVGTIELRPAVDARGGQILAVVENRGNVHVRPEGRAIVRRDGDVLGEVALEPEVVIPGYARALRGFWVPESSMAGPLEIEVVLDDPTASGRAIVELADPDAYQPVDGSAGPIPGVVGGERPLDTGRIVALSFAVLLLLLTIAMLFYVWRRRQRDEEPEPSQEPARHLVSR